MYSVVMNSLNSRYQQGSTSYVTSSFNDIDTVTCTDYSYQQQSLAAFVPGIIVTIYTSSDNSSMSFSVVATVPTVETSSVVSTTPTLATTDSENKAGSLKVGALLIIMMQLIQAVKQCSLKSGSTYVVETL